ncbi:MAG: twin-arginine translocase TatA/TatE family subunit [Nitrospinae bacterium]|nr:twin-arginine translocase TatA/TatE family subunit [Nitrospinota bacterium]
MMGLGMPEMMVILLLVLLVFGAKRLPEIGGGLGKGIKNFREQLSSKSMDAEREKLPEAKDNA